MAGPEVFTTRPELKGTFGMVSSTHWLATQCGMAVLETGGNAFVDREYPKLDHIIRVTVTP